MAAMLRAVYAQFAMEGAVDADAFDAMTRHMGTAFASRAALLAALKAFGRPIHNPRARGDEFYFYIFIHCMTEYLHHLMI